MFLELSINLLFRALRTFHSGFPGGTAVKKKNPPANAGDVFDPWVGKTPWTGKRQSTPLFLPGKSHGQRTLVCYRLWGRKEPRLSN